MSEDLRYLTFIGSAEVSVEDDCLHGRLMMEGGLYITDIVTYEGETVPELRSAFIDAVDRYIEYRKTQLMTDIKNDTKRCRLIYLDSLEGEALTYELVDDGYRIYVYRVDVVSGTGEIVNRRNEMLWAEYKQCDDPCIGKSVARALMGYNSSDWRKP